VRSVGYRPWLSAFRTRTAVSQLRTHTHA